MSEEEMRIELYPGESERLFLGEGQFRLSLSMEPKDKSYWRTNALILGVEAWDE